MKAVSPQRFRKELTSGRVSKCDSLLVPGNQEPRCPPLPSARSSRHFREHSRHNSAVYYPNDEENRWTPSVMSYRADDEDRPDSKA